MEGLEREAAVAINERKSLILLIWRNSCYELDIYHRHERVYEAAKSRQHVVSGHCEDGSVELCTGRTVVDVTIACLSPNMIASA